MNIFKNKSLKITQGVKQLKNLSCANMTVRNSRIINISNICNKEFFTVDKTFKNNFLKIQSFNFAQSNLIILKNLELPKHREVEMPSLSPTMTKVNNIINTIGKYNFMVKKSRRCN